MRKKTSKGQSYQLRILIVWLIVGLLASCRGGLSDTQRQRAEEALKSLRKISAATSVGINAMGYAPLVIDAKAQTNEAALVLPDGQLKTELNAAAMAYVDAQQVWSEALTKDYVLSSNQIMPALIAKYQLEGGKTDSYVFQGQTQFYTSFDKTYVLRTIWQKAEEHLNKAQLALNPKK